MKFKVCKESNYLFLDESYRRKKSNKLSDTQSLKAVALYEVEEPLNNPSTAACESKTERSVRKQFIHI